MAAINDLIRQVEDKSLRERLQQEVARLSKQKKFGLVFEDHIPECTPLYGIPIRKGSLVAVKGEDIRDVYCVSSISGGTAAIINKISGNKSERPIETLVVVAQFGEPIYPSLISVDSVTNAPDSSLWHTLIEADNFHALQLLEYLYPKQVDCIYIDPPYNSRAKDWKYNNDYVDPTDSYRHSMCCEWEAYCTTEQERLVKPILVVQVNDRTDSVATTTDINTCLDTLEEELGRPLEIGEVVHTFNDESTLNGFSIPIVRIDPSKIEEEEKVLLVFFKMNLSTGWDCPRAEVMMSFRSAQDHTYIAQLLGRMVRTPLAHRIEMNGALNAVHLFLPFFDQNTVSDVVRAFKEDENSALTEAGLAPELVTLVRNSAYEDVFEHMNDLVTYRVEGIRKESNLRRLDKLRAYITVDGINRAVDRDVRRKMSQKLRDELTRIKNSEAYEAVVDSITGMSLKTLEVELATNQVVADSAQNISVAQTDTEVLYKKAEKTIGDYIAMQYRVENSLRDDMEVKIELIVLASDVTAMDNLELYAGVLFDETYNDNRRAIQTIRSAEREKYERLISSGSNATPLQWRAPFSISFNCPPTSSEYGRHLFVDDAGICKTSLNPWEDGVLQEELSRPDFVAWLRNLDRKNWSIEIPYRVAGINKPMYPDMMIVRQDAHGYIFDILEPHDSSRADNYPKAKGLAEFAQTHSNAYGRIQLIRKLTGADGASHFYRLDLTNITVQRRVMAINSNEDLDTIFNELAQADH